MPELSDKRASIRSDVYKVLVGCAKAGKTISYSDLCKQILGEPYMPNSNFLAEDLTAISQSEKAVDRGLLSVIVIRKSDRIPGDGFFRMVGLLRADSAERRQFCDEEKKKVFSAWASRTK
jgi:hypothetical protein